MKCRNFFNLIHTIQIIAYKFIYKFQGHTNIIDYEESWKSTNIPREQFKLVSKQLYEHSMGKIVPEFSVILKHLNRSNIANQACIVELGCSSGYYSEVIRSKFPYVKYVGLDYSEDFINFAKQLYFNENFVIANVKNLPLNGKKVDCLILGSILLHLADWRVDLQKFIYLGIPRIIVHRQPIVIDKATYFQFKNAYKTKMFEWIINRDEIIGFFKEGGYELIYETSMSSELIYESSQPITITLSFSKL